MKKTLQKKMFRYIPIATAFLALLSGCDEENGDNANLSMALQDKGISWFSSETYGSAEWVQTTLKYDELSFTNSVSSHNKFTQDETGGFQQEAASTKNFLLTNSGWQLTNDKLTVSATNSDHSIILTDMTEPLIKKTLTGTQVDIIDKSIYDHFNTDNKSAGWTSKIIDGPLFSKDSLAYQATLRNDNDLYTMWDLNANCAAESGCNEVWIQPADGGFFGQKATGLSDIPTETATNATGLSDLKAAFLTWDSDQTVPLLAVELVTDGTANFYTTQLKATVNDESTFPASATKSGSNTWQEKEVFGKTLYLIEVPEPLATDFGFSESSRHIVFFEHEENVRRGEYKLAEHTESLWVYNNSAKNDILDNLKQNENSGGGNNGNWQN